MDPLVLIVGPPAGAVEHERVAALAAALALDGLAPIAVAAPQCRAGLARGLLRAALACRRRRPAAIVTVGRSPAVHAIGAWLRRPTRPWIADLHWPWPVAPASRRAALLGADMRRIRTADGVAVADPGERRRLHAVTGAVLLEAGDPAAVASAVRTAVAATRVGGPLRILMLGLTNTPHVEHLAIAMAERGHRVVVGGEPTPGLPPSILPRAGIPVRTQTFPTIAWLRRLLREERPDVVHAHWLPGYALLAVLCRARPLVAMAWGSDVFGAGAARLAACRHVLRRADASIADSGALHERLLELGADPARSCVINWGIDLDRFAVPDDRAALKARLGLGPGPVILGPRTLRPLYNPTAIIAAFESVAARHPDAQLVLKHIDTQAPELGRELPPGTRVVGHVPYEELPDWYGAADVVVSIPDSDSSPRSVWEAMACGAACVLSDLPWVRELIVDGEHALVVAADARAVAAALDRLLTDGSLRERLAARGRALAEQHRDRGREMDRLEQLYGRLAAGAPRAGGGGPRSIDARMSADESSPVPAPVSEAGAAPAADSLPWWDSRSRLDALAAVLDPSPGAETKNRQIDRIHRSVIVATARAERPGHVLDFGCGTGRLSAAVAPYAQRVTGVDISAEMVSHAAALHPSANIEFVSYDGARLPFDDASFDAVISALVLQMYSDDPSRFRAITSDLVRTLRPGGTIWLLERVVPQGGAAGWTRERWASELAACGLELTSLRAVRRGAPSLLFRAVLRGLVPEGRLDRVAAADAALAARMGVRAPYTECLMRAVRR